MNSLVTFLLLVGMAILVYNLNKLTSLVNQNNEDLRSKIILIQRNIMSLQETKEEDKNLEEENKIQNENKEVPKSNIPNSESDLDLSNQIKLLNEDKDEIVETFENRHKGELPKLESQQKKNLIKNVKSIYNQYHNYKFEDYFSDSNYNDKYYKYCPKKN